MADWFCRVRGQLRGPLSPQDLRALAQSGQLAPESLVRQGTAGAWVKAARVKGLFQPGAEPAKTRAVEASAGSATEELPKLGAVDEFGLPPISAAPPILPVGMPVGTLPGADLPLFDESRAIVGTSQTKPGESPKPSKGVSTGRVVAVATIAIAFGFVGLCTILIEFVPIVLGVAGLILGIRALLLSMRSNATLRLMSAAAVVFGGVAAVGGYSRLDSHSLDRLNAILGGALSGTAPPPEAERTPPMALPPRKYQAPDEVAIIGTTHVSITGAYVSRLPGRDQAPADEPVYLMVTVRLQNRGQAKMDYVSWSGTVGGTAPTMGDDLGSKYKRVATPRGVTGQLRHESLYPGDAKVDLLVFERPVPNYNQLELILPAAAIGETDPIRFKIPRSMVQVDATPTAPPDSTKTNVREIRPMGEEKQPVEEGPK